METEKHRMLLPGCW